MSDRVEVHFESIALQDQRVRGEPDDYLMSVVHFAFRYPDGRIDTGCVATVRHRLRDPTSGAVEIVVSAAYQCPAYGHSLKQTIEEYYRQRVGFNGSVLQIGPKGASPLIIGVPRESPATATFEVGPESAA